MDVKRPSSCLLIADFGSPVVLISEHLYGQFNIILVQSECSQVSRKNTLADTTCNHPSKTDFGLVMNGSVRDSLKTLPKIIAGFLSMTKGQEDIRFYLNDCIKSQDCRIYTMLDKKKENTMTLCIVVNETKNCFVSTCSCQNNRTRRSVQSHLFTPIPKPGPQEPTCKLELISSENITDTIHGNITNLKDERFENPMECTTLQSEPKKYTMQNKNEGSKLPADGDNKMFFAMFIGFGVGALIGSLATFLWFKRKASMPKILSVVNGIYKGEISGDNLYLQNVTEYSEIPDCMTEFGSEQQGEPQDSPKQGTRTKFHAFPKEDKDGREHTKHRGVAKKTGLVPLRRSDNYDAQQEEEYYINNGIKKDTYLNPFNMIDVTNSPDMCIECPRDMNDVDSTTKEEGKTMETHAVHMENLNSNATYFVLKADKNKKSSVRDFTDCEDGFEKNKQHKVTAENVNSEKKASGYKEIDKQDSENVYFELSKSS